MRGWGGGLTFTLCTAHAHHTPTQWMFTLLSIVLCGGCWVQTPHQPSLGQLYLLSILNISSKMTGPSRPAQQSIEMRRHNPVLLWPLSQSVSPLTGAEKGQTGTQTRAASSLGLPWRAAARKYLFQLRNYLSRLDNIMSQSGLISSLHYLLYCRVQVGRWGEVFSFQDLGHKIRQD